MRLAEASGKVFAACRIFAALFCFRVFFPMLVIKTKQKAQPLAVGVIVLQQRSARFSYFGQRSCCSLPYLVLVYW